MIEKLPHLGSFQKNNYFRSENPLVEVWERIIRLSSINILKKELKAVIHPESFDKLIPYISTRLNQAVEFKNASTNQTLLTKPLSIYYSTLNMLRALISINYETEADKSHGLKYLGNKNILESSAKIVQGTFYQFLENKGLKDIKNKIFTLKDALGHIIELSNDIQVLYEIKKKYTPFGINASAYGEIEIYPLKTIDNFIERWKDLYPNLINDYSFSEKNILTTKNEIYKKYENVVIHINKIFLSDLNRLSFNDKVIWYLFDKDEQPILPRIAYYYISIFILSNIVRYEPEILQLIISERNEIFWILNRFMSLIERFFPQLFLIEIYGENVYF